MKKMLLLFGAVVMAMTSCTSENSEGSDQNGGSADPNVFLPKKVVVDDEAEVTLTYNGRKVVKAVTLSLEDVGEVSTTYYTYNGDLLIKEVEKEGDSEDSFEYTYENNKLKTKKSTYSDPDGGFHRYKTYYTHKSNGIVEAKEYNVDSNGSETLLGTTVYTYVNGNIVKEEETRPGTDYVYLTTYDYDNKNTPFKNILGFDKLIDNEFCTNNFIKSSYVFGSQAPDVTTKEFTYNAEGYPVKVKEFYNEEPEFEMTFTY